MIFCAKFYFSEQMATMAIGNANPGVYVCFFFFSEIFKKKSGIIQNVKQTIPVQKHPFEVIV